MPHVRCGRCDRPCDLYCIQAALARFMEENQEVLDKALPDMDKPIKLSFCGFEIILDTDSTYWINDTTGG